MWHMGRMTRAHAHPQHAYDGDRIVPEYQRLSARGMTFRVTRWHVGSGGRPLLFLNGLGADADAAAPLLRRITNREVWTLDMPGTGGSPDCFWPYSASSMASAVMDVADQLGHHQLDVAGFSWGGALAQQLTAQFSDRVVRLVLMGTTGRFSAADIGWGAIFDRDVVSGAISTLKMPATSPLGFTYQSLAMTGWNNDRLIPNLVDRPILILSATKDHVVPSTYSDDLANLVQAHHHVKISGGHLFPFTKAQQCADEIMAFLAPNTKATAPKKPRKSAATLSCGNELV